MLKGRSGGHSQRQSERGHVSIIVATLCQALSHQAPISLPYELLLPNPVVGQDMGLRAHSLQGAAGTEP